MRRSAWLAATIAAVAAAATAVVVEVRADDSWVDSCATSPDGVISCTVAERPAGPKVAGELLDGGHHELSQDLGKVIVVNFWGSWCAPCRAEIDDLEQAYQTTKSRGVVFLGINIRDDRDRAIAFHAGRTSYPSLFDPASRTALAFEVSPKSTPSTFILDRQGRIAVALRRATKVDELTQLVERVAAEQPPSGGA